MPVLHDDIRSFSIQIQAGSSFCIVFRNRASEPMSNFTKNVPICSASLNISPVVSHAALHFLHSPRQSEERSSEQRLINIVNQRAHRRPSFNIPSVSGIWKLSNLIPVFREEWNRIANDWQSRGSFLTFLHKLMATIIFWAYPRHNRWSSTICLTYDYKTYSTIEIMTRVLVSHSENDCVSVSVVKGHVTHFIVQKQ